MIHTLPILVWPGFRLSSSSMMALTLRKPSFALSLTATSATRWFCMEKISKIESSWIKVFICWRHVFFGKVYHCHWFIIYEQSQELILQYHVKCLYSIWNSYTNSVETNLRLWMCAGLVQKLLTLFENQPKRLCNLLISTWYEMGLCVSQRSTYIFKTTLVKFIFEKSIKT